MAQIQGNANRVIEKETPLKLGTKMREIQLGEEDRQTVKELCDRCKKGKLDDSSRSLVIDDTILELCGKCWNLFYKWLKESSCT